MNRQSSILRPRRGFTLIEILVSITIIIVMAAIVTAVSKRIGQKAKAVASVERVRDIGASVISYASDTGEMPVWHDYDKDRYWWELIQDSEGSTDPTRFQSPSHKGFDRENPRVTLSYGYNYLVMGRHKGTQSQFRGDNVLRMTNFSDPSRILVVADGPAENCWGYIDPFNNKPDPLRYGGKAAAAFLDGSGRLMDSAKDFLPDSQWFVPVKQLLPR